MMTESSSPLFLSPMSLMTFTSMSYDTGEAAAIQPSQLHQDCVYSRLSNLKNKDVFCSCLLSSCLKMNKLINSLFRQEMFHSKLPLTNVLQEA